jgi:predicted TIM-barrel fold metal-dependent hydrolase
LISRLAIQFRKTIFVLDHLGRPQKGSRPDDGLFISFLKLAEFNNIFIKLSGLNYYSIEARPYKDTWPLLHAAKEAYSVKRCMWGSDYPFVNEYWSYEENLEIFRNGLGFDESDLEWILGKTAENIWWIA